MATESKTDEVITFGYDPDRQRVNGDKMFPPVNTGWYPAYQGREVGETRSQPLILDGSRFGANNPVVIFMAKNHANDLTYLYGFEALSQEEMTEGILVPNSKTVFDPVCLDPQTLGKTQISRSSTTFYEGAFVSGTATGTLTLHNYNKENKQMEWIGEYDLGTNIVSAPMVVRWNQYSYEGGKSGSFEKGIPIVVSGSDDGNVYIVSNLHMPHKTKIKIPSRLGGVVSSSPSPIYDSRSSEKTVGFVIGRDSGTGIARGYFFEDFLENGVTEEGTPCLKIKTGIANFNHIHRWQVSGVSGISSSFTTEKDATYFSDKAGKLIKVNNKTGDIIWTNTEFAGGTFQNRSPAIDDKYVYYGITDYKGLGRGILAILDKQTGETMGCILAPQEERISTSPVVWKAANLVLFGIENGNMVGAFREHWNLPSDTVAVPLNMPAFSGQAEKTAGRWDATGLTSEISIAQNLLVIGGKMNVPEGGGLSVFTLSKTTPDWYAHDLQPGTPYDEFEGTAEDGSTTKLKLPIAEVGQSYVTKFKVGAAGCTSDKPVLLKVSVNGETTDVFDITSANWQDKRARFIVMPGQEQEREYSFAWSTPDPKISNTVHIVAEINSDRGQYEENYENNKVEVEIPVMIKDVECVSINNRCPVMVGSHENAEVVWRNNGPKPQTFLAKFMVDGVLVNQEELTLQGGESVTRNYGWSAPNSAKIVKLEAEAVLEGDEIPENNYQSMNVIVDTYDSLVPECVFQPSVTENWDVTYSWTTKKKRKGKNDLIRHHHRTVTYAETLAADLDIDTKQGIETDPTNPKFSDRESRGSWEIIPYANRNGKNPNHITRAGYGFEIKVKTNYNNNWESRVPSRARPHGGYYYGPTAVIASIYDSKGKLVKDVMLERTSGTTRKGTAIWELPKVAHTFEDGSVVEDRKFYTSVNDPDGNYTVQIKAANAGKHGLAICKQQKVEIYGTMYDDIYTRVGK